MAASNTSTRKNSRAWLVPASLGAGALALSLVTGSLGAFTASITNDTNTAGAGGLTMQETSTSAAGQTVTCTSTQGPDAANNKGTCSTINKYGGNTAMSPGQSVPTTITLKNTGSVNATAATLTAGACTPSPAPTTGKGDLCGLMQVDIKQGTTSIFTGTAAALAAKGPIALTPPAAGASVDYTITATLPTNVDNSYTGTAISQPLTWAYTA